MNTIFATIKVSISLCNLVLIIYELHYSCFCTLLHSFSLCCPLCNDSDDV